MTTQRDWGLALRAFAGAVAGVLVTALLVVGGVRWILWPNLAWVQPVLESWASETVDLPVKLGELRGAWQGWVPRVVVRDGRLGAEGGLREGLLAFSLEGEWGWNHGWRVTFTVEGEAVAHASGEVTGAGDSWGVTWRARGIDGERLLRDFAPLFRAHAFDVERVVFPSFGELVGRIAGAGRAVTAVSVQFADLSLPRSADFPGMTGISGSLEGSRERGSFAFEAHESVWHWPAGWFAEEELRFTDLLWQGTWRYAPERGYALETKLFRAVTPDGRVTATGTLSELEHPEKIRVDMHATLEEINLRRLTRYLPPAAVGEETVAWLSQAFVRGSVPAAHVAIVGPLAEFPFREGQGSFLVEIPVQDVTLKFDPRWPPVTVRSAMVRFRNEQLAVEVTDAQSEQLRFAPIVITIPDLEAEEIVLIVEGKATGAWQSFERYLAKSPLAPQLPLKQIAALKAKGEAALDLWLTIPLNGGPVGAAGTLTVERLALPAAVALLPVEGASVRLQFDSEGVRSAEASGRWGGIPVSLLWPDGKRPEVRFTAEVGMRQLAQVVPLPVERVRGSTQVTGRVTWSPKGVVLWQATSDATGLTLDLPAPLTKAAPQVWRVASEGEVTATGWRAEVAIDERVRWRRDFSGAWGAAIGRATLPEPSPNGRIALQLDRFDLDAWRALLPRGGENALELPDLTAEVAELIAGGQPWHQVRFSGAASGKAWRFRVDATEVAGEGTVTLAKGRVALLEGAFARLWLSSSGGTEHRDEGAALDDPAMLPSVRLTVADLRFGQMAFGALSLDAVQKGELWQVREATLALPQRYRVRAEGSWRTLGGGPARGSESQWQINTEIADLGTTLRSLWDLPGVERGSGTLKFTISWSGSPLDFSWQKAKGRGEVDLKEGLFREIDPGAGRLLTVFSLPMVLRRLKFDFSDLEKGLAYDRVVGSFALANGYLTTADLTIDAPVALTQIVGSVDLNTETQELEVRVVPRLTNTAATALAFANPIAGILTYLGQQIIGDPLGTILMQRYRVSGSWRSPQVGPVDAGEGGKG